MKYARAAFSFVGVCLVLPLFLFVLMSILHERTSDSIQIPSPLEIVWAFPSLSIASLPPLSSAWQAMGVTLTRVGLSVVYSLAVGVLFGLVLGKLRAVWLIVQPTVDFFRSIPITFFLPAATLLAGSTKAYLPWVLATIPCALIMLLQIRQGVERISPERVHAFELLSGSRSATKLFWHLTLREVIPEIVGGLRLATSYAIVLVSVLEYMSIGSERPGFGLMILRLSDRQGDAPALFAGIVAFGLLGFSLNWLLEALATRLTAWRHDYATD